MAFDSTQPHIAGNSEKFIALCRAISARGLTPPETFIADDCVHYFDANAQSQIQSGWYCIIGCEIMICIYADTHSGIRGVWYSHDMDSLTAEEEASLHEHVKAAERASVLGIHRLIARERLDAHQAFEVLEPVNDHPFLQQKGVLAYGLRTLGNTLVIPMRDTARQICGLQTIAADGTMQYLFDSGSRGCYFSIGTLSKFLLVCKDYVTAASIHMATGCSAAAAFRTENLQPVAEALREKFPRQRILIAGDDEWLALQNTGLIAAYEAAKSIGAPCVIPKFGKNRPVNATNFNDMHTHHGLETVRAQLLQVLEVQHVD